MHSHERLLVKFVFFVTCVCFSPLVQFQLLHSKFHLCSLATRQLMLSTYVKFINLFPEIKTHIQQVDILALLSRLSHLVTDFSSKLTLLCIVLMSLIISVVICDTNLLMMSRITHWWLLMYGVPS